MYYLLDFYSKDKSKRAQNIENINSFDREERTFYSYELYPNDYYFGLFKPSFLKLTDIVVTYLDAYGLFVSQKAFDIIKGLNLQTHKVFNINLLMRNNKNIDYKFINVVAEDYSEFIEYQFDVHDWKTYSLENPEHSFLKKINFNQLTSEDYINLSTNADIKLKLTNLVVSKDMVNGSGIDLFYNRYLSLLPVVSQRLKDLFENSDITGCDFRPIPMTIL